MLMTTLNARAQTLGSPCQIQGIPFEAGTQVFFGLSDELVLCVLPTDRDISGIPCQRGLVHFQPSGELGQATLGRDFAVRGVTFARGTMLSWNEDGTLGALLAAVHTLSGATIPVGSTLRLDEHGKLISWSRRLVVEEKVSGIPCQAGSIVTCFANGQPERITIAHNHTVDGMPCMAGTDVELHPNGRLAVATLAERRELHAIAFEPGTALVFRPDGSLSVAQLVEDMDIAGRQYTDGTFLLFDERGLLTDSAAITWEVMRPALS
jgi:hypothetical protein